MSAKRFLRKPALALGRPVWRWVWVRIEARLDARFPGGPLLARHPAAFLDAVSTVAALGRRVEALQRQVTVLQQQRPDAPAGAVRTGGGKIILSFDASSGAALDGLLSAALETLAPGAALRLSMRTGPQRSAFTAATAAAEWLRGHDFADVRIDPDYADAGAATLIVSARLAAAPAS